MIFIDTAGMRKSGKVKKAGGLEEAAVRRNERVVRRADVTLFVIDASEPIGTQERTLAGFLKASGSGVIVIVNKWDLVEDKTPTTMNRYREYVAASIPFLQIAPVLFVSALTRQRVRTIFDMIDTVQASRTRWVEPEKLEAFLRDAINAHPTYTKILGLKQVRVAPPEFDLVIKAKRKDVLSQAYVRYLINRMSASFRLTGTPVRVHIRLARSVAS